MSKVSLQPSASCRPTARRARSPPTGDFTHAPRTERSTFRHARPSSSAPMVGSRSTDQKRQPKGPPAPFSGNSITTRPSGLVLSSRARLGATPIEAPLSNPNPTTKIRPAFRRAVNRAQMAQRELSLPKFRSPHHRLAGSCPAGRGHRSPNGRGRPEPATALEAARSRTQPAPSDRNSRRPYQRTNRRAGRQRNQRGA